MLGRQSMGDVACVFPLVAFQQNQPGLGVCVDESRIDRQAVPIDENRVGGGAHIGPEGLDEASPQDDGSALDHLTGERHETRVGYGVGPAFELGRDIGSGKQDCGRESGQQQAYRSREHRPIPADCGSRHREFLL